jgi:hypothetical protein
MSNSAKAIPDLNREEKLQILDKFISLYACDGAAYENSLIVSDKGQLFIDWDDPRNHRVRTFHVEQFTDNGTIFFTEC